MRRSIKVVVPVVLFLGTTESCVQSHIDSAQLEFRLTYGGFAITLVYGQGNIVTDNSELLLLGGFRVSKAPDLPKSLIKEYTL